jgi:hypothetical protein
VFLISQHVKQNNIELNRDGLLFQFSYCTGMPYSWMKRSNHGNERMVPLQGAQARNNTILAVTYEIYRE